MTRHVLLLGIAIAVCSTGCRGKVPVVVSDCHSKRPIPNAQIRVEVESEVESMAKTDGKGRALIVRPRSDATVLYVTAKGYAEETSMYGRVETTPVKICLDPQ